MVLAPIDRDRIVSALRQFDQEHRDAVEWEGWESNQAHHYAIEFEGNRYPVKRIVSIATSTPVSQFSGGYGAGQANQFVEQLGFRVIHLV